MAEVVCTIVIDSRFSGPPGLGNGGYVAGVVAGAVGSEATVTLRAPIPLDTPLELTANGAAAQAADGATTAARRAVLRHEGRLLAEAVADAPDLPPPPAPDRATAAAATARYSGRAPNLYQECFVCGFAREPGSGLRVFAGPTAEPGLVAADWPVHPGARGCERRGSRRVPVGRPRLPRRLRGGRRGPPARADDRPGIRAGPARRTLHGRGLAARQRATQALHRHRGLR